MGLRGMRERLLAVGGNLATAGAESAGPGRFAVTAVVPVRTEVGA
jgi:signal transduction histidine kinase